MTDVLFLLGERPPVKGDHKRFSIIQKACGSIFRDYTLDFRFVVQKPNPDLKTTENIKKQELLDDLHVLCDYVETHKPKIIVAMGLHAFQALHLANTKITEIQCEPQFSPMFGTDVYDLRKTKKAKSKPLPICRRGILATDSHIINTSQHSPIIWPCHKHDTYFAFWSGYKGMTYFEDQMKCVHSLLVAGEYKPHMPEWFDKYIVYHDDLEEAEKAISHLATLDTIAFDIETAGPGIPKEAQLNPRHEKAKISCIAIGERVPETKRVKVHVFDTLNMPETILLLKGLMKKPSTKFTWNGKFDINFIKHVWNVHVQGTHIDGLKCLHLYDMGRASIGKGSGTLKTNCSLFLSTKFAGYHKHNFLDKAMKQGDGDFIGQHWDSFLQYCGIDVFVTYGVVSKLWNSLAKDTKKLAVEHYQDLNETLNSMHEKGMKIEVSLLDKYISELTEFCNGLSAAADDEVHKLMQRHNVDTLESVKGGEFSIQSKANVAEVMYDVMGLPPELTEKGNPTVSKDVLHKYESYPFVEIVLTYNYFVQQLRLMETLKAHTDEDGYCYPFYDDMRTASGRLSCRNPNIQQMSAMAVKYTSKSLPRDLSEYKDLAYKVISHRPIWKNHQIEKDEVKKKVTIVEYSPKFKKVVVAPKGYTLVYADYAQIEVYVLGNYITYIGSKDMSLQDALIKGLDIHSFTTSKIYTILKKEPYDYEFILANKNDMPYKLWRGNAKTVLFSLIYGKGYKTFAAETGVPEEDAKQLFDVFMQGFPGIQEYMDWAVRNARRYGETSTIMGHRRKIKVLKYQGWNKKGINQSYNTPIQGSAGTIVLTALNKLHEEITRIGGRPAFTVHDSIGLYVPTEKLEQGIEIMRWCMEDYPSIHYNKFLMIPLKIDLGICEPSWADEVEYKLEDIKANPYYKKIFVKGENNVWTNSTLAS